MGGGSSKPEVAPKPQSTRFVQILDSLHWEQLAIAILGKEEDSEDEENFENYTFVLWYRSHFSEEFDGLLFPPAFSDLGHAREGHALRVSHHQGVQAYVEEYLVWGKVRGSTLTSLREVVRCLVKASSDVDIANLSGSVTCLAGGVLSLIGILLAMFTFGASLALTATGTALAVAGAVTSTGAVIADGVISASKNKEVQAILEKDLQASERFNLRLDRLNLTTKRLNDWTEQHLENATQVPTDIVRAMCGMFGTINNIKKFSVAVSEQMSAVKAAGRAIHAADECVTFASHSGEGAMAGGAVLSMSDDVVLAGGRQGAAMAGKSGRAMATEAAAISGGAVALNVVALAVDVGMIAYLSYRIHNGSPSSRAEDIRQRMHKLGTEKRGMHRVYKLCEDIMPPRRC